jgi:hypothetical protein
LLGETPGDLSLIVNLRFDEGDRFHFTVEHDAHVLVDVGAGPLAKLVSPDFLE